MNHTIALKNADIRNRIYVIRDQKVLLDTDLAGLYDVETSQLKRAVRRNNDRFPDDFMFELTHKEFENLRCQIGISSWGGSRYTPMAFTEQGVAMLSSVLNSKRAIEVNIQIMRLFLKMRQWAENYHDLLIRIEKLETNSEHIDKTVNDIYNLLTQFLKKEENPKPPIGFRD